VRERESGEDTAERKTLYAAVWRWHFYAGLYVAPFLLLLPLTGLVMLAARPIEAWKAEIRHEAGPHPSATDAARYAVSSTAASGAVPARCRG
jgi:uncharacterized iron-regulated membrane protein